MPGNIKASQSHCTGRYGLVATHQRDHSVQAVAPGYQFDGISHCLAGHQGAFHTLRAHRNAVGDDDAAKLDWRTAAGAYALFQGFSQITQVYVAWCDIRPGVHNSDHWLVNLFVIQPGRTEHGAGWCPVSSLFYLVATHDFAIIFSVINMLKKNPQFLLRVFQLVCCFASACTRTSFNNKKHN